MQLDFILGSVEALPTHAIKSKKGHSMSNQIEVKIGQSCTGYHGLIEQPKHNGLDVRVFEILDNGSVVYRYFDEWFSFGERARTYGTPFKTDAFCIC